MSVSKIISGGQTGVDRAALDFALNYGLEIGGYCPLGRKAEDGVIPAKYGLVEMDSDLYPPRTKANILHSDATLILVMDYKEIRQGGTSLTLELCERYRPQNFVVAMMPHPEVVLSTVKNLVRMAPTVLNVSGPRESKWPGIYEEAKTFLLKVFARLAYEGK